MNGIDGKTNIHSDSILPISTGFGDDIRLAIDWISKLERGTGRLGKYEECRGPIGSCAYQIGKNLLEVGIEVFEVVIMILIQ
jgi:hypothetical protein